MIKKILQNPFSRKTTQAYILLLMIVIVFVAYSFSERATEKKNKSRYESWLLADEMRETSDDLTRMARLYVMTGNPIYKSHYQAILDIRNGTRLRPVRYNSTYWSLYLEKGNPPRPDSPQNISLLDLMRKAGFTDDEFKKLDTALVNSDWLVHLELEAFRLIETSGKNAKANHKKAQTMLFDHNYQSEKVAIMKPIDEFFEMITNRTEKELSEAEFRTIFLRNLFIFLSCLLLIVLYQIKKKLDQVLGGSVDLIHDQIKKLGKGDFTYTAFSDKIPPNSVLGLVVESQIKLKKLETQNKQTEEALRSAIAEAHEALQTRDEFMSIASHEIKTPVTALSLRLQTLNRSMKKHKEQNEMLSCEEVGTSVNICEKQCRKLTILLDELLDLTRIRLGRLTLHLEKVDLCALTKEAIDHMKSEAKGIQIHIQDCNEIIGDWDPKRIEQVVNNLISNGIKYGEGKPLDVFINQDKEKHLAQLIVKDHGPGIAPEMQSKIFERFERAISSKNISGLGLGLYITRQIVEAHKGSIRVQSTLGQGSTFIVELPITHDTVKITKSS